MPMFLVVATDNSEAIRQAIEELKVEYYDLKDDIFFFPYPGTAKQLAEKLGIQEGENGSGLVIQIDGYSGRAPADFWPWMNLKWRNAVA